MKSSLKKKKIAIVGASGYIGSKLVLKLSEFDCSILRISRNKDKLKPLASTLANIMDFEVKYDDIKWEDILDNVDLVYYLSSQTSTYIAEKNIIEDYNSSVKPIVELLKYCEKINNNLTIIFSSAVTICGLTESLPVDETFKDNPVTIYDVHKLLIENYIKFYCSKSFIKGTSLRLANVYGPGTESSSSDRGILNKMISRAMEGHDLSVYGKGNYLRDYIYLDDVVDALLKAYEYIDKTNGNHYIISSGEGNTIKEAFELITKKVSEILEIHTKVNQASIPDSLALIEYRNFIGNSDSFMAHTKWKPTVNLNEGIKSTIKEFKGIKKWLD
ncbi:MAG: NAD-dependent epimerase/dehydratase family protein [Gammaproteobacteria bacterium]|nr:NAD-dependent epimerase/dehydratase family protein [Gammaproteobacteria bacterium]